MNCKYDIYKKFGKRFFDVVLTLFILPLILVPSSFIFLALLIFQNGRPLYWSQRVGRLNKIFVMPKFRTMSTSAPLVASHLLSNPTDHITPLGIFLRKYSLDEFPQIWSVLKGDMSFVGPRPALFNQCDLIALRGKCGVTQLVPGITGLAQINGRDNLSIVQKVDYEIKYLNDCSFFLDVKILLLTFLKVLNGSGVTH